MITARAIDADGKPILLIGLSMTNMGLLLEDKPIDLSREKLTRLGFEDLRVVLVGGLTEDGITAQLEQAGLLTGGTEVRDFR